MCIRSKGDFFICGYFLDDIYVIPGVNYVDGKIKVVDIYMDRIKRK